MVELHPPLVQAHAEVELCHGDLVHIREEDALCHLPFSFVQRTTS
jgi:hypothetical protein